MNRVIRCYLVFSENMELVIYVWIDFQIIDKWFSNFDKTMEIFFFFWKAIFFHFSITISSATHYRMKRISNLPFSLTIHQYWDYNGYFSSIHNHRQNFSSMTIDSTEAVGFNFLCNKLYHYQWFSNFNIFQYKIFVWKIISELL